MKINNNICALLTITVGCLFFASDASLAAPLLDQIEGNGKIDAQAAAKKPVTEPTKNNTKDTNSKASPKSDTKTDTKPDTKIEKTDNKLSQNQNGEEDKLRTALEYVYVNHPRLKAQREAVKVSDEGISQAVSEFRPNVSANFSKGRQRTGDISETWDYDNTKSRNLTVNQPLFSGGGSVASFMAAKKRVKAARANLSAVEQQVIFDAIVAYTDVVEKQSVLELNHKNVEVLQKQMDVTNAKFKVGELTMTDVSQSKARLALAQSNERQALGDLEATRATFRRTIGFDATDKIVMPGVPEGIPESLEETKELAQSNNPVLLTAHYSEEAADNDVYIRSSTLLPTVSLQGTMNRSDGNSLSSLNKIDQDAIMLNVSIPIYQSGAEWSRLREARNLSQQAKFNKLDTNLSVLENANISWEAYKTSQAVITSNEAAVAAAETALNGVRKENEFGVRTILDVLNAEEETFSAKVNLVKAVRSEKIHAYRLLAATGKLTGKSLKLNVKLEDPKEHYDSVKYQLLGL
ncbi:MAG: TolC family outer membrane protein [Pseudomonadota bacterium]